MAALLSSFLWAVGAFTLGAQAEERVRPIEIDARKSVSQRPATRLFVSGVVVSVDDTTVRIKRTIRSDGRVRHEVMRFLLSEKVDVAAGDRVRVGYVRGNGGNVALDLHQQ